VAGSCEHDSELPSSIKGGRISSLVQQLLLSQEGLFSMESVSFIKTGFTQNSNNWFLNLSVVASPLDVSGGRIRILEPGRSWG
jgi:hypothetical protein